MIQNIKMYYFVYLLCTEEDGDDSDYNEMFIPVHKRSVNGSSNSTNETNPFSTTSATQYFSVNQSLGRENSSDPTPSTQKTVESVKPLPDVHLSNTFVKAVFDRSERENLTMALGLCRKTPDLKFPSLNATALPMESAGDIHYCLNNMLINLTANKLCYPVDPGMFAFLRWLIESGVPKVIQHKSASKTVTKEFLFPYNSCEVINKGVGGITATVPPQFVPTAQSNAN